MNLARRDTARSPSLRWHLLLSLLLHGAIVLPALSLVRDASSPDDAPPRATPAEAMRVRVLDADALRHKFDLAKSDEPQKPKPAEPPKPKPEPPERMLPYTDMPRVLLEQQPDRAQVSARQATKVEREQIKSGLPGGATPTPRPAPQPQPTPSGDTAPPPPARTTPNPQPPRPNPLPEPPSVKPPDTSRSVELKTPSAREADITLSDKSSDANPDDAQTPGPPSPPQPVEGLVLNKPSDQPSAKALFRAPAAAAPSSEDRFGDDGMVNFLRDVPDGDRTLLNRKQNRYWTFFDRMKRQLEREWKPQNEYNRRDPYRNVYGIKDRYAVINVTLKGDGSVQRLYVDHSSGLDFYDDEAVRALMSAGPYSNPPEGLKDEDGLIHIRYGFYLQVSSGSTRFFRINR